jgi:hypothetical protein
MPNPLTRHSLSALMVGRRPVRQERHQASSYEDPSQPGMKMASSRTTTAAIPNAERPQVQIRNPVRQVTLYPLAAKHRGRAALAVREVAAHLNDSACSPGPADEAPDRLQSPAVRMSCP